MLIDTHCHLTDEALLPQIEAVIGRAVEAGVTRMVTVATDPDDWREALPIATAHPEVWLAVGVHPHRADRVEAGTMDALAQVLERPKVVALGEVGLDYHYDFSPRARQLSALAAQLQLARTHGLPVVVHCREALEDTLAVLDDMDMRNRPVVFHCFTGTPAEARQVLDRGWWLSFAGVVTFKSASEVREAARLTPADRLLVETDSPYLTPEPIRRVRPNEPAHVVHTVRYLAELRGVAFEELARISCANAQRFFAFGEAPACEHGPSGST